MSWLVASWNLLTAAYFMWAVYVARGDNTPAYAKGIVFLWAFIGMTLGLAWTFEK